MLLKITFSVVLLLVCANAATLKWTGLGTTNLWDDLGNWESGSVPTDADDAVVPISSQSTILVANQPGIRAKSLSVDNGVTISVQGAPVLIGPGGVQLSGSFIFNQGASLVKSVGVFQVQSKGNISWESGAFSADVNIELGGTVALSAAASRLTTVSGRWTNKGTITIVSGVNFVVNGTTVVNNGEISFQATSGAMTLVNSLAVVPESSGSISVLGSALFCGVQLQKVMIQGTAKFSACIGGGSRLTGVSIAKSGNLIVQQLVEVIFDGVASAGNVQIFGMAGPTVFTGQIDLYNVQLQAGYLVLNGNAHILSLNSTDGKVECLGSSCAVDYLETHSLFSVVGKTAFTVAKGTTTGSVLVFGEFAVTQQVHFLAPQVTVNGLISIAQKGELIVGDGATKVNWGPADIHKAGSLNNLGLLTVNSPVFTMNWVDYHGFGGVAVKPGQLHLLNTNFTVSSVALTANGAELHGESVIFNYDKLLGPAPGATIKILMNTVVTQCTSPCTGDNNPHKLQVLQISL